MPFVIGDVQFNISASDRQLLADLADAERAARRSAQTIQSSLGNISLGGLGRGALQFAGLGAGFSLAQGAIAGVRDGFDAVIGTGVRLNAQLETTTLQFETLTGSATEAREHVADLFQFAA